MSGIEQLHRQRRDVAQLDEFIVLGRGMVMDFADDDGSDAWAGICSTQMSRSLGGEMSPHRC
jgi:hypothetical protein